MFLRHNAFKCVLVVSSQGANEVYTTSSVTVFIPLGVRHVPGPKTYGLFRWSCLLLTICDQRTQFTGKMEILYALAPLKGNFVEIYFAQKIISI